MRSWRAGSITLGVALVSLGVSMLISKISGLFTLLDVARWWPILLIILGCEILASLFISGEKPLKVKFDRGSIFLTALILLFTMSLSTVSFAVGLVPGGFDTLKSAVLNEQAVIYREYTFHSDTLTINNKVGGSINLSSWDNSYVLIKAAVSINNITNERANYHVDKMISLDEESGVVAAGFPELPKALNSVKVNWDIKVPKSAGVKIVNSFGNIDVLNAECNLTINNKYGHVCVSRVNGKIDITSEYNEIEIFEVNGDINVKNKGGGIYIAGLKSKLNIDSKNGDVKVLAGNKVNKDILVHSANGNVKILFSESQSGIINAVTYSGNLDTNITSTIGKDGGAKKVETVLKGEEKPMVYISVNNGDLELFTGKPK